MANKGLFSDVIGQNGFKYNHQAVVMMAEI